MLTYMAVYTYEQKCEEISLDSFSITLLWRKEHYLQELLVVNYLLISKSLLLLSNVSVLAVRSFLRRPNVQSELYRQRDGQ